MIDTIDKVTQEDYVINPAVIALPAVGLVFAFVCVCLPIRTWLRKKLLEEAEANADNTLYKDKAVQFQDCYDSAFPLT